MAGEIAAAASGMQAPSQPGSVAGDVATAISGLVAGQRQEEERRRKQALEEAAAKLEARKVDIADKNAQAQQEIASAQTLQAESQAEYARIAEMERRASVAATRKTAEENKADTEGYKDWLVRRNLYTREQLDAAGPKAIKDFYDDAIKQTDTAQQREIALRSAAIAGLTGGFGPAMTIASNNQQMAKTRYDELKALGLEKMKELTSGGFKPLPAWMSNPELQAGTPEGDAVIDTFMLSVPREIRDHEFAPEMASLSQAIGMDWGAAMDQALAGMQNADQAAQELSSTYSGLLQNVSMAGVLFNTANGSMLTPEEAQAGLRAVGPVIRHTPGYIDTTNGGVSLPVGAERWNPEGATMQRFAGLTHRDPIQAWKIMNQALASYSGKDEAERVQQAFTTVLQMRGLTPELLQQNAEEAAVAAGLRVQRSFSVLGYAPPPTTMATDTEYGTMSDSPGARAGRRVGAAAGAAAAAVGPVSTRSDLTRMIKDGRFDDLYQYARSKNVAMDTVLAMAETQAQKDAIRDRWPARVGR